MLDAPASFNELAGQPIKQLRMRRRFAHYAEVIFAADQSVAKMVLPDAIRHNSRRQGIVGRSEPISELPPSSAAMGGWHRGRHRFVNQDCRHSGPYLAPQIARGS